MYGANQHCVLWRQTRHEHDRSAPRHVHDPKETWFGDTERPLEIALLPEQQLPVGVIQRLLFTYSYSRAVPTAPWGEAQEAQCIERAVQMGVGARI